MSLSLLESYMSLPLVPKQCLGAAGINSVMFYAPVLFKTLGSSDSASLLNTVIVGAHPLNLTFHSLHLQASKGCAIQITPCLKCFLFMSRAPAFLYNGSFKASDDMAVNVCRLCTGVIMVLATLIAVVYADRWGRHALFLSGEQKLQVQEIQRSH